MIKDCLALGQRVYDTSLQEYGVVVVRIVDGEYVVLEGYEDNQEVEDWKWAVTDEDERLIFLEESGVMYTYIGDHEVTEINA